MPALWATIVAFTPIIICVVLYNRLIRLRNLLKNAFAQIDVQLQRRYTLIPNLVEAAKGYLEHEQETLEAVIKARGDAMAGLSAAAANPADPWAMQTLSAAESTLTGALGRLMAVVESYPNLKADQTIAQLSEELTSTENRVAFARQAYNDAVLAYNNACQTVPTSVVASAFSFIEAEPFAIEDEKHRIAPQVSFA